MEDTSPIEQYDESVGLVPLKPSDEEANESLAADILEGQRKLEKMQRWGRIFYGENFERYTRVHEMEQYLPAFRDFYISEVTADPKVAIFALITEFNKRIAPAIFYPRPQQYQNWRGKWDTEILNKRGIMVDARKDRKSVV